MPCYSCGNGVPGTYNIKPNFNVNLEPCSYTLEELEELKKTLVYPQLNVVQSQINIYWNNCHAYEDQILKLLNQ